MARTPPISSATSPAHDDRALFELLRGEDGVVAGELRGALRRTGLSEEDPRLAGSMRLLRELERAGSGERTVLGLDEFARVLHESALVLERALRGRTVIPDFEGFCGEIEEMVEGARANGDGSVATYIPQLARVEPDQMGVALCTIDGQSFAAGEASEPFCVQSCCKPLNYLMALEERGADVVHAHIGCEPSGHSFNALALDKDDRPHNPMINAGGIMSCSLIGRELRSAERFDRVLDTWRRASGGARPGFDNPTYLSERRTADRNFALGYFMREKGAFEEGVDLVETLEFYFQCCSVEMTARSMAVVAATLANGGICPTTGERVFRPDAVQKCLSLMYSCGMYDFSGEWAFTIGLPAKSGVAGAILVVVPNVMGLCTWSPRLDEVGNSVRGIDFCRRLVGTYNFHNYDNLVGIHDKRDPRRPPESAPRELVCELCWAAGAGDLPGIRQLAARGADLDAADYDGRTPLHVAAAEGRAEVVRQLLAHGAEPAPVDRFGGTPLDDARRGGHEEVAGLLADPSSGTAGAGGAE